jgi:hypothetical protein
LGTEGVQGPPAVQVVKERVFSYFQIANHTPHIISVMGKGIKKKATAFGLLLNRNL